MTRVALLVPSLRGGGAERVMLLLANSLRRAESAEDALQWVRGYFARARENDFLMGRIARVGEHANWRCDLDFLLTDKGMKHVIEKTLEAA